MNMESLSARIDKLKAETRNIALEVLYLQSYARFIGKPPGVKRFREQLDVAAAHARKFLRDGL